MKKIIIENILDIADFMYDKVAEKRGDVTFIELYNDASEVIKSLLMSYGDVRPYHITLEPEDWDGYDKEYLVTLDNEMNIWCEKAYSMENKTYLYMESACVLVADDCNSAILKDIEYDEIYEVSYDLDEDLEDNSEDDEELLIKNENEGATISRTKDGRVAGFSKTWSNTDEDGVSYYSSFSHYSDNEELVKKLAKEFGIRI